jgi:circadian clock protein KaiC
MSRAAKKLAEPIFPKCPSGIEGLDQVTLGGLPRGRPTLVCGGAGCGKTLFAIQFLVRGALDYDEPGVFITFEETAQDLTRNTRSLGFGLERLVKDKKLAFDHVQIELTEFEEAGPYDLDGLIVRLGFAIDSIGAKRIVLDSIDVLFGGLSNQAIIRSELRRLFRWLNDKGITAIVTAERGIETLTRSGLEEYVADCVILLDNRIIEQNSTRRVRVVKYRGSAHGTDEYPFMIDENGIAVLPITSAGLTHEASEERVTSGIAQLDSMFDGAGYYRGSTVLASGTAGTGKTSLAGHLADATCRRGERCMFVSFEESPSQIVRNMRHIGMNLAPWIDQGTLRLIGTRPTTHGLETHLAMIHKWIREFEPKVVIIDPISNLISVGSRTEAKSILVRLIDYLKSTKITAFFTNLTSGGEVLESTEVGVSSLIDTWILLRDTELGGERNRGIYILKSRGMDHSNQIREFRISQTGVELLDVYSGPNGSLTGSSRLAHEAQERAAALAKAQAIERMQFDLEQRRKSIEAQVAALRSSFEIEERELSLTIARQTQVVGDRLEMHRSRNIDLANGNSVPV